VPTSLHEVLIDLFRQRPLLAPELLRDALGIELPEFAEARIEAATLGELAPAQFHADLVVLLQQGAPVLGIIVEAQLQRDDDKLFSWPAYAATLRARSRCPTCVLVVTPEDAVARWAGALEGGGPGWLFKPLVVGPGVVPVVTEPAVASAMPELAVLSALAHGQDANALEIAVAALGAVAGLPDEAARVYSDLILDALNKAARRKLEELMDESKYVYKSDFAIKHQGLGRAEGRAEGLAEGKASSILTILQVRGLSVTQRERDQLLACKDLSLLEEWTRRALSAASTAEVLQVVTH
jgi:hypothetical protein